MILNGWGWVFRGYRNRLGETAFYQGRRKFAGSFVSFVWVCVLSLLLLCEATVVIWIVIWIVYFQYIVVGK